MIRKRAKDVKKRACQHRYAFKVAMTPANLNDAQRPKHAYSSQRANYADSIVQSLKQISKKSGCYSSSDQEKYYE